jgi:D-alanine-D-alanine ligase
MPKKIRVAVLFGGKSAEHEVSLQSAKNVFDAIDRTKYDVVPVGIDKQGRWLVEDEARCLLNADDPKRIKLSESGESVALVTSEASAELIPLDQSEDGRAVDVVFPALHGPLGEDGTVQGLLRLADVPFVGADVLGSAVGMDKDAMKRLLRDAGIPGPKFVTVRSGCAIDVDAVVKEAGLPCFVKPANMGSSVGVTKVKTSREVPSAIDAAFRFDHKVLVEEAIVGRELECSVLGNENPIASVPGEVIPNHEFYSYDAKYIDENGAALEIPAEVPESVADTVRSLAVEAFQALYCEGMARVDFFLQNEDTVLVNEVNTIPGFTKISMYPKLWEASGIGYTELIDRLIQLAMERHERDRQLTTSYDL